MLTQLDLRHFKCFEALTLPLGRMTVLTGTNASGKSTVIQALVLLHQTMREHEWSSRLILNGAMLRLGTVQDVVDQVFGTHRCEIGVFDDERRFWWVFGGDRHEMAMDVLRVQVGTEDRPPGRLQHLLPEPHGVGPLASRVRGLTYLTAERLGPREHYPLEDPELAPVVGAKGEHAISVLFSGRDELVLPDLAVAGVPPTRYRQVEARMAQFFPGCLLAVDRIPRSNAATLGLRTSNATRAHRPIHTGFGLTQVLPIVVAALSAQPDDLLLIENPEVHLHPAGQAKMGEFLSQVAAAGVQVLVETHSDHVLSGVRRAVKQRDLDPEHVAIHFFRSRSNEEGGDEPPWPQVQSPMIDANGDIDAWPDGFFDQFDKDMSYFAGWD